MNERKTEFGVAGRTLVGFFVEPTPMNGGLRPAVMVLHGGAGVGAHERDRAEQLAELGYVAFVPDLFGERFATRERGIEVIQGLVDDPPALRVRLAAAVDCVRAHPLVDPSRVAAIGFCFGGLAALELARSGIDMRAVVSFHGGLTARAPAETSQVKASILVCAGAADPFVTREHRNAFEAEMKRAGADWDLYVYGGAMHGFTEQPVKGRPERPGAEYHGTADRRSWTAMRAFLEERLG